MTTALIATSDTLLKQAENVFTVRIKGVFKPVMFEIAETLKEASSKYRAIATAYMEEGGDNLSGAFVFTPEKKCVAWISPNGRVWRCKKAFTVYRGQGVSVHGEFTAAELVANYAEIVKV